MKNLHWQALSDDSIRGTVWETTAGDAGRITSGQFGDIFGDREQNLKLLNLAKWVKRPRRRRRMMGKAK